MNLSKYWRSHPVGGLGEDWTIEEWSGNGDYWTSTTDASGNPKLLNVWEPRYTRDGNHTFGDIVTAHVRPIRAFSGRRQPRQDGEWRIGDLGPGGGIVVYDRGDTAGSGRYLEVAPSGWNGKTRDPLVPLLEDPDDEGPLLASADGKGLSNTRALESMSEAAAMALAYTGGGLHDWFLPTRDELRHVYEFWACSGELGLMNNAPYWTSSNEEESGGEYRLLTRKVKGDGPWGTGWDLVDQLDVDEPLARVRPVRWFR